MFEQKYSTCPVYNNEGPDSGESVFTYVTASGTPKSELKLVLVAIYISLLSPASPQEK